MTTFTSRFAGFLSATVLAVGMAAIAQPAAAGIVGSMHDFSSAAPASGGNTVAQICVYCHTPHGADTIPGAPIWNRFVDETIDYGFYGSASATMDGDASAGPGSVSRACLSCHDGTQALDALRNMPGTGSTPNPTPIDNLVNGTIRDLIEGDTNTPGVGLDNDHPIGMNYCAAPTGSTILDSTTCVDTSFSDASTNGTRFFIEAAANAPDAVFQKYDLPLFGSTGDNARVECATCHDPHQGDQTISTTFLRVKSDASEICLTCHTK